MKEILLFALIVIISCGIYQHDEYKDITYSQLEDNQRMLQFNWANFNINNEDEIITQIQIEITTKKTKIGNWKGVFGTTTTIAPFLYITENMQQAINDDKGSIIWDVPDTIGRNIEKKNGILQFGIWWIDCDSFQIKSIIIITS